jgi:hypothetical protein
MPIARPPRIDRLARRLRHALSLAAIVGPRLGLGPGLGLGLGLGLCLASGCAAPAGHGNAASPSALASPIATASEPAGHGLRVIDTFATHAPTGVAISRSGRTFIGFAGDDRRRARLIERTPDGERVAYPSAGWNDWRGNAGRAALRGLIDVRGVWIDADDTLWVLDAGVAHGRVVPGGPKLMQIDLALDEVERVHYLPVGGDGVGAWRGMTDVRVDRDRGVAYFLDAGRGAVVVYDMHARAAWSAAVIEPAGSAGLDAALEIDGRGDWLYVSDPRAGGVAVVPTATLRDRAAAQAGLEATTRPLASTGGTIGGMWLDGQGRLFLLRPEDGTLLVRGTDRAVRVAVRDATLRRARRVTADPGGRLFVTVAPAEVLGWGKVGATWEGALVEVTGGRSAVRLGASAAPMSLSRSAVRARETPPTPARSDPRGATPNERPGLSAAGELRVPPAGVLEDGRVVVEPIQSKAPASATDRPRARASQTAVPPSARHEIDADPTQRAQAVAGVEVQ